MEDTLLGARGVGKSSPSNSVVDTVNMPGMKQLSPVKCTRGKQLSPVKRTREKLPFWWTRGRVGKDHSFGECTRNLGGETTVLPWHKGVCFQFLSVTKLEKGKVQPERSVERGGASWSLHGVPPSREFVKCSISNFHWGSGWREIMEFVLHSQLKDYCPVITYPV